MTVGEMRLGLWAYRTSADEEGASLKDGQLPLERLIDLYQRFDRTEREMANEVLAEWVLSNDENVRFDGLALVNRFGVGSALPALNALADRLRSSNAVSAPYDLLKVQRIQRLLASGV